MLRDKRGRLRQQLGSIREPAYRKPASDFVTRAFRLRDRARLSPVDHLNMDAALVAVSEVLPVRGDVSINRRIAARVGSEPAGLRFGLGLAMCCEPKRDRARDKCEYCCDRQWPSM